jgi:DNA-binding MarR family transcriptional regulator
MVIEQPEILFFQEKPVRSLLLVKKADKPIYASIIAKEIDSTYAHTLNVLFSLKERGLVVFEKKGRIKHVKITEIGKQVAGILEDFIDMVHLSELSARIERVYEKMVLGRPHSKVDQAAVSKRLAPYKRELERLSKSHRLKELSNKLTKRIEEISKREPAPAGLDEL